MDNKKNGIPKLRFPGFTGAWEQRKLGEVVERFDNLRIPVTSSKREKGITPYYGANGIQDYVQGYTHDGEFVLVAEDGANDLQNYPVHYVNGKVWVNNHAHVLQGKNKMVENLFLVNAIKQIKIETYLVGGSRAKLNADVMMKLPIKVPTFNEQQKIGEYFSKFDTLITLHQRKLEHLQEQKKGLLQKMFPKNGETVPEVRFPGFTDAWEQRKLGEVFDTVTDYVANGSFKSLRDNVKSYTKENYAYMIRLQDASNNWKGPWLYTDEAGYSFLTKSKLHPNDIIMSNVGSVGKFFLIPELDKPMTLAPNAVLIKSSKNNALFLYQMMISTPMQVAVGRKTTPGVQLKINKTDFKRIQTNLPSLNEQEKIGEFFKQLDSLITLHQRKLDHLELMKKGLLQQMFV